MVRRPVTSERGFTLIEILVVILMIGILTALALPAFLSQTGKANDADAKALARTGLAAMETYAVQNGDYNATEADVIDIAPEMQSATSWTLTSGPETFTVAVLSKGSRTFSIEKLSGGNTLRTCSPAGGGCPDDGTW